ncbi:MAG: GNAT family N-acetyltransferase [Planctomycetaceae bacterium]|nr:GNAT family N-acetyltransferase [Planctomycetaceae bacterium]
MTATATLEPLPAKEPPPVQGATAGPFSLGFLNAERRSQALAIWRVLENELGDVPLLASYDWTELWLRNYGDLVPHRFVTFQEDGRYVGVALLTQGVDERRGWCGERVWHLGTAGEPDRDSAVVEYNGLVCLAPYRHRFLLDMIAALESEPDWDALQLDGFVVADLPPWMAAGSGWEHDVRPARWTDLNEVRGSGRELITFLGDSTRKGIRQSVRKLGGPRFEWSESVEHAHHIFDDLIRLHQTRWNAEGKPGCYASARFTQFHRDLVDRLVPQRRMALARLSTSDRVLCCSQVIIDRRRALVYQGGRVLEEIGSPGLLTDFLCMQECLARGYAAFDFMAGDSIHKKRLTTQSTPLSWSTWRRPRWKYRAVAALKQVRNACRGLLRRPSATVAAKLPVDGDQ